MAMLLQAVGCGKSKATEASGPATTSVAQDANASPGATAAPVAAGTHRFPDDVLELLRAAPDYEMATRGVIVAPVPAALTDKFHGSSDPLVRQLTDLQAALTVEGPLYVAGEQALRGANLNVLGTSVAPRTHTVKRRELVSSVGSNGVSHSWWRDVETEVEDEKQPDMDNASAQNGQALREHFKRRFQLYTHLQQLAALARQIAVQGGAGQPAGDAIGVGFNDDPKQVGTVMVRNKSTRTLHHCLIIVVGFQNPPAPETNGVNAAFNEFGNMLTGVTGGPHNDEEAAMPSVAVSYRDQLAPGDGVALTSCMSGELRRVKSTTAAFWSDEVETGDVPVNDMADALRRLKEAQVAAQKAINQLWIDQRKSVHVTADHGAILYQFLAYPTIDSQPVAVPQGTRQVNIAWPAGAQVQEQVDGFPHSSQDPSFVVGSKMRFHVMADGDATPVPVAVRFLTREPTDADKAPFVTPPWPPTPLALPPQRQAQHATLLAYLTRGLSVDGTVTASGDYRRRPVHVEFDSDEQTQLIRGMITWDSKGAKKLVEGWIVDDLDNAAALVLCETDFSGLPQSGLCGMLYTLHVQEQEPGHLVIHKATYGDFKTDRVVDVTDAVKALVANDALKVAVSRQRFPDPALRVVKTLKVEYTATDGTDTTASAREHQTLTIPANLPAPRGSLIGTWVYGERTILGGGRAGAGTIILNTNVAVAPGK